MHVGSEENWNSIQARLENIVPADAGDEAAADDRQPAERIADWKLPHRIDKDHPLPSPSLIELAPPDERNLLFRQELRHVVIARGVESTVKVIDGHPRHTYFLKGEGKGPPVVVVHGLGGSANGFYKTFFPLAKVFREVWAPDLPGSGFSPLPKDGALKLEDQVRLLDGFL